MKQQQVQRKSFTAWFIEIVAALFILLFVYTALSKLYEHKKFVVVLGQSPLVGNFAHFISYTIPILELIIAVALFIPSTRLGGMWASLILMSSFSVYIAYMIMYAPNLPCSCGGVLEEMTWKQHLVFNIGCTVAAFMSIIFYKVQPSPGLNRKL